jgi:hypothetical protein
MKIILNSVHKFKLDPNALDATIISPVGAYTDLTPDICFMCWLMKKVAIILDDSNRVIHLTSSAGSISISLKSVTESPNEKTVYYLTVNGKGGDVKIEREQMVTLNRVLHQLYFQYAY